MTDGLIETEILSQRAVKLKQLTNQNPTNNYLDEIIERLRKIHDINIPSTSGTMTTVYSASLNEPYIRWLMIIIVICLNILNQNIC